MKFRMLGFLLVGTVTAALQAEDIELSDGRRFLDASIHAETAMRVVIKHRAGLTGVNKELLPPTLAAKYPLKPELAAEEARRDQAARIAREQQERELKKNAEAQAELHRRQVAEQQAQAHALAAQKAKALSIGSSMVGDYFTKRYSFGSGQSPLCTVQVQEVGMIGDSPNRWRLSGSVVVRVSRDIVSNGNSAERAQYQADAANMGARELRHRRANMEYVRTDTYGFDADLDDLDGTPSISVNSR